MNAAMYPRPRDARPSIGSGLRMAWAVLLLLPVMLAGGCGDESTGPGTTTPEDQVREGMTDLVNFGNMVLNDKSTQVTSSTAVGDLVNTMPLPTIGNMGPLLLGMRDLPGVPRALRAEVAKVLGPHPPRLADIRDHFGTWERDVTDATEPFPGWVLVTANDPPDGLVFQFGFEDDVSYVNDQGVEVPLQGEIRFLEVTIDDNGTVPEIDDILTHVVFEIAASELPGTAPTLVRINPTITLDAMREVQSLSIGDAAASSTADPDAAFLGDLLIHVFLQEVEGTVTANLQLFDSAAGFVLAFDLGVVDVDADLPTRVDVSFGFGETVDPTQVPWEIVLAFTNFRRDPLTTDVHADVAGSILGNGATLATLAGDTTEVPVDLDGDGEPDDTCVNVDISFPDDPETSQNLCEFLGALASGMEPVMKASLGLVVR